MIAAILDEINYLTEILIDWLIQYVQLPVMNKKKNNPMFHFNYENNSNSSEVDINSTKNNEAEINKN